MPLPKTDYIWMNGEFVRWEDAKIHVLTHAMHYGSSWFEGIRAYKTPHGTAIFRLREHVERLHHSTRIYSAETPYSIDELCEAIKATIVKNNIQECYIRPLVYRGYEELGINPLNCPVDVIIAAWTWGKYLGKDALNEGVDVGVSSWTRIKPNTMPTMSKAGGNYMNSQLAKVEAIRHGYSEAIMLDGTGCVSEGSGQNIFFVSQGCLHTPSMASSILPGVTRASIMAIARGLGLDVVEGEIPRGMLYTSEELFFTGTAAEITPIRSVDGLKVGDGKVGSVTKKIQDKFFSIVNDGNDEYNWLTYVDFKK
ncbi:MAG TPA: branched-chain amino acid transaminase [Patescibacteria group bacterium]|nr:branched-chain amino acid transaminase [Patescibacteria group bacterium]